MKRPLQVGDRVRIYFDYSKISTGEILSVYNDGGLRVRVDIGHLERMAHPKQCRRLIPKKRRSVWVGDYFTADKTILAASEDWKPGWTEFREIKNGKK